MKYAGSLANNLRLFKKTGKTTYQFRCPYCGDSKKNKLATRGYFYKAPKADRLSFKCHNCGESKTFQYFLKEQFPSVYSEYKLERLKESQAGLSSYTPRMETTLPRETAFTATEEHRELVAIKSLGSFHPATQYVRSRMLPEESLDRIYFVEDLKAYVDAHVDDKTRYRYIKPEPRIVFPIREEDGSIVGCQARIYGSWTDSAKYKIYMFREGTPKIIGREQLDKSKEVIVVEGFFDSLYLENSIAMSGASFPDEWSESNLSKDSTIVVYDNEPRNEHVVKAMRRTIDKGWKVVIWDGFSTEKDISDMVSAGADPKEILNHISTHAYAGVQAKLKLTRWSRA